MSEARTKKERFLPWAWERFGLTFDVVDVLLDGNRTVAADPERRLVVLEEEWSTAAVRVRVGVHSRVFDETLPVRDDAVAVVVAVRCDDTRLRFGVRLPVARAQPAVETTLRLERNQLAGQLELSAHLVRERDLVGSAPGFAGGAHERLAGSRPWELRIDRKRSLSGVYLDVRYRSFAADPSMAPAHRTNLWQLEMDLDAPILWLNSDHQDAVSVLDAKGHVGARAALRDVTFDLFVPSVWMQLVLRSVMTVKEQGEVGAPWQDAVLDAAARLLFPQAKVTEDARHKLNAEMEDVSALISQLDAVLQADQETARHLLKVIGELT